MLSPSDRLDTPASGVPGYEVCGRHTGDAVAVSIKAPTPIGVNTTIWLNTDQSTATGYMVWGFAVGAEYNVNIGADGVPRLYSGAAGQTLIGSLSYTNANNTLTVSVPVSLIGNPSGVTIYIDVNDAVFLPNDYSLHTWRIARSTGVSLSSSVALKAVSGVTRR